MSGRKNGMKWRLKKKKMMIYSTYEKKIITPYEESVEEIKEIKEYRCDYSGKVINMYFEKPYVEYNCDYKTSDPCFGSYEDEYKLIKKYGMNIHKFLSQSYIFNNSGVINEEDNMINEILEMRKKEETYFPTLEAYFRFFKVRTARILIEDYNISPDNLYI